MGDIRGKFGKWEYYIQPLLKKTRVVVIDSERNLGCSEVVPYHDEDLIQSKLNELAEKLGGI